MFSSRSFIVYSLTYRSLVHFEFIFVCGMQKFSFFFFSFFFLGSQLQHMEVPRLEIGAIATGLYHSHSKKGSEPPLLLIPQLTATLDP